MTPELEKVLYRMLSYEEGNRRTAYLDSKGILTVGIGHMVRSKDKIALGQKISEERVRYLYRRDIKEAFEDAVRWLGKSNFDQLSVNRQAVIVGMAYQMGFGALLDFSPTRKHILAHEWQDVVLHFFGTKWYQDTPKRVERLALVMKTDLLPAEYQFGE